MFESHDFESKFLEVIIDSRTKKKTQKKLAKLVLQKFERKV